MRTAGLIVLSAALACSGGDQPRHQQLAAPDGEVSPQIAAPQSPPAQRRGERVAWDPEAESSDQLTVHGDLPSTRSREYRRAVANVRKRVAMTDDDFDLVFEPPFVVVGDGGKRRVKRRAERTVRWAVGRLKKAYFSKDPTKVLEIWLFNSKRSYERNTEKIFGEVPDTPYGYYSSSDNALVMNIATGGGTLVHEIVHPFVEANVPDAPAWLNEGMGSLYEASADRNGHIVGVLNWRLPGLQRALRNGAVPTFRKLTAMSDRKFYGVGSGVHYAQARYLLYYLQEKGLLHDYYKAFMANRAKDKTGYAALVKTLAVEDMKAFEQRWAKWVRRLRYRR